MPKLATILAGALLVVLGTSVESAIAAETVGYDYSDYRVNTTQDLFDICTMEDSHGDYWVAKNFCFGFFAGGGAYHAALTRDDRASAVFCPPSGATRADAVDVFIAFARSHPQYMSEAPIETVARALVAKWPCQHGER